MRRILPIFILMTTVFFACGQERKSTPHKDSKELDKSKTVMNTESQTGANVSNQKHVDTRFVYTDSIGHALIIENSYPKGGLKYTDRMGEEYVYAVFWTRITNETNNPFEFKMDFSEDSYELPSSPGRLFKLLIPPDTMTSQKEPLFNYGLDLEKYLDNILINQAVLKRTVNPKSSNGFYIVTLFNIGVDGTLRTGLSIKEQKIFYRVNDKEIHCGNINLKTLKLKK
jgi:hypothetical protein